MRKNNESIFLVLYEEGSSTIHEYMSAEDYAALQKLEKSGAVRIMNHVEPMQKKA